MVKRLMDIILSALGLVLLAAPMLCVALFIRLGSPGAAIFRQRRAGWRGNPFTMLKFRTMRADSEPYGPSPGGGDDPRLTRLGRLLRETSLDELPQLLNVLAGQMSLVGPRPLYERQAALWNHRQRRRLEVRPGITGYAQVYGRAGLTHEEKIELDVRYVDNQSFLLDVKILAKTFLKVLRREADVYEQQYSRNNAVEPAASAPAAVATAAPQPLPSGGGAARRLNILFTCAGRRVSLLQAFRAAMAELGIEGKLVATDITDTSPAFQLADVRELAPAVGQISYVPALLNVVRKHQVNLLVPLTDLDVRCLGRQRAEFAKLGCTAMVGSEQAIMTCRDKRGLVEVLKKAGLPTIRTLNLADFKTAPFYPCFIKPLRGSGGIGAGVLREERDLKAHVATYGELMIVQDYVPGPEYTVDVYRSRDGQVRSVVPRQRLAVRSGEVEKGLTIRDAKLTEAAVRLSAMLGDLWGVFCLQCRIHEGQIYFFEVNPRFGGGAPLSIQAGANFPLYVMQEVLGLPITARMGQYQENLLMMRFDDAYFMKVDNPELLPGIQAPTFR
jgi:carbamoyl-phosphate synthase large subunit